MRRTVRVNAPRFRKQAWLGLATSLCVLAPHAFAQQTTPTPAPAPPPRPEVFTLPNVTPERFTLGTPTPVATPVPVASPTPAPPPVARATPTPQPRATQPRVPTPAATATPEAPSAIVPQVDPVPTAPAQPSPVPAATPAAQPAAAPGTPAWVWLLAGAGGTALLFGLGWALRRRREAPEVAEPELDPVAAQPPEPLEPSRSIAPPPGLSPKPAAASVSPRPALTPAPAAPRPASAEPFELQLIPTRIEVNGQSAQLELELLIGNHQGASADNVRVALALMSANPDQDSQVAGFHANPMIDPDAPAFDLAPGAGGRLPVRLSIAREHVHVVEVGGRPMFVPMVLVDLRWRAGISIRRMGADFMVGTAGQGSKLGPIWLDRPQLPGQLASTRYRQRVPA